MVAAAITRCFRPGTLQYAFQQYCVSRPSRGRPVSGDGSRTNTLELREHLGVLDTEFAFAGSTTQGPVSRHATNSRLEEPVFGRRIGAVSTETVDWPVSSGNIQAIPGHDFLSPGKSTYTNIPTPYTGSGCRFPGSVTSTTIIVSCRSPVRALTRRLMIGLSIPVRMTMVPGVLSTNSSRIQLHNQLPYNQTNNVTRCHIQKGSSWPARFSLMNCRRLTVSSLAQCHVCQHWHKPIIPFRSLPNLVFLFLRQ